MFKHKIVYILFFAFVFCLGFFTANSYAAEKIESPQNSIENTAKSLEQESFRATVIEVIKEKKEDNYYQDLKLRGKDGSFKDQEIIYLGYTEGISSNHKLKKGDVVFMLAAKTETGNAFLIQDKSRLPALIIIGLIFIGLTLLICRKQGLRALLALLATFVVIISFVVPRILSGEEPIGTIVISSVFIVVLSIIIIHGWNKKSKIAIAGMLSGVFITATISHLFTEVAYLSGSAVEEAMFLKDYLGTEINFSGLLLASFILGSLGILDDIAITQTSTAKEISKTDTTLKPIEIFKKTMNIGVDHIASMINTLFLAYAGASFTLLLLFGLSQAPFDGFLDVINNELVATEIIRTLVGSIGLILTVPITTYIASQVYGKRDKK